MPIALIIGVGDQVGRATAETFAAAGYKVALASRTQRLDSSKFPFFQFDASEPADVPALFEKVHKEVGVPEVVIYNAYSSLSGKQPSGTDITSVDVFAKGFNVNSVSLAVAAEEAVKGFAELESQGKLGSGGATFIYTGNALNQKSISGFFSLGLGKAASAYVIEYLASHSHNDKPFSYYFVDERQADGTPMFKGVNAEPHAEVFLKLAQDPKQNPWLYTFSKENGYAAHGGYTR